MSYSRRYYREPQPTQGEIIKGFIPYVIRKFNPRDIPPTDIKTKEWIFDRIANKLIVKRNKFIDVNHLYTDKELDILAESILDKCKNKENSPQLGELSYSRCVIDFFIKDVEDKREAMYTEIMNMIRESYSEINNNYNSNNTNNTRKLKNEMKNRYSRLTVQQKKGIDENVMTEVYEKKYYKFSMEKLRKKINMLVRKEIKSLPTKVTRFNPVIEYNNGNRRINKTHNLNDSRNKN